MKYLLHSFLFLLSLQSYAQETRESESREPENEKIDNPYLAPDKHSMRTRSISHKIESTSSTLSSIVTTQVNIDTAGNNITLDAANEPNLSISPINPNNIVIGWRQFDNIASNFRQAGFSYSSDGGITWAAGDVIEPGIFHSDPVLDCDSAGNFYYNSLGHDTILGNYLCYVFKSTNNGASWDSGTFANGGDKQWMVIDKSGLGINNIYSFWTTSYSSCSGNNFTRSTNGGLNYEPCSFVPGDFMWGTMDIDDTGALYIVGVGGITTSRDSIIVSKSVVPTAAGPGLLWNTKNVFMDGRNVYSISVNPDGLIGQMNIAADHSSTGSGNIYLAGSLTRISSSDQADVMFCRSTDGGQTWDPFVRINDDAGPGPQQWLTTMSVAPNGRIDIVWLDTRDNSSDNSALYYSYSYDQGNTWSVNEKLSQSFDPHVGYPAQNKMGDYFDMISDNVSAHLAWANTLNGEEDVYYSTITPPLPTAITESANPPLAVYPNPSSGNVKVNSLASIRSIEVYSVDGSLILEKQVSATSTNLDLSFLSNGIYFLNIHFENGMNSVRKLILSSGDRN